MALTVEAGASALLQRYLEPGEALDWAAQPQAWASITPPKTVLGLGLLWAAFDSFYVAGALGPGPALGPWESLLLRIFALHGVPVALLLGWPLWRWLDRQRTAYAISDRRVLVLGGLLRGRPASARFDALEGVDLRVGGGARGMGSVTLHRSAPAGRLVLRFVDDAYEVSRLARQRAQAASTPEGKPSA